MWAHKRSTNVLAGILPALVASKQIVEPTPPTAPKPALQLTARGRVREVASGHLVYETPDSSVAGCSSAATGSSAPHSAATGGNARLVRMIMESRHGPSSDVGAREKRPDDTFPNFAGYASSDGRKPLDKVLQPHPPPPRETGDDDESSCQDGPSKVKYVMCRRNRTERIVKFLQKGIDQNPWHSNMEEVFLPKWMGPSLQRRVLRDLRAYQEQARAKTAKTGIAEPPHTMQEPPPRG
mmetsp:Transcript_78874/g.203152  ORF Transcript_78874/g.203152 Transcript_78874/m.203152 type:complete len:238 (+) Transcript_78874:99-812(+)